MKLFKIIAILALFLSIAGLFLPTQNHQTPKVNQQTLEKIMFPE